MRVCEVSPIRFWLKPGIALLNICWKLAPHMEQLAASESRLKRLTIWTVELDPQWGLKRGISLTVYDRLKRSA